MSQRPSNQGHFHASSSRPATRTDKADREHDSDGLQGDTTYSGTASPSVVLRLNSFARTEMSHLP
ncbi:hypothetical protein BC628DRAFT_1364272, partial [Trametes gibbosa]